MTYTVDNVLLTDGREVTVEVYGRGGQDSPEMWILIIDGKRIVPYQSRRLGLQLTLQGFVKVRYYLSLRWLQGVIHFEKQ